MYISKKKILVILGVFILFAALFVLWSDGEVKKGSFHDDPSVSVAPSEFVTYINSNIVVENGQANVLIENNEKNHNICRVKIYESENDKLLYESDIIPTGYCIEKAQMLEQLPRGEHDGYAVFVVLNDALEIKSTLTVDLKLTVI